MWATRYEHQPEIADDAETFSERTGPLWNYSELNGLGFRMFSFTGAFWPSDVPMLLDYCKKNPCYHIISITASGIYKNCYMPDQRLYVLGDGDSNPDFELNQFLHKNPELFAEEGPAKAFAMFSKVDEGDEAK